MGKSTTTIHGEVKAINQQATKVTIETILWQETDDYDVSQIMYIVSFEKARCWGDLADRITSRLVKALNEGIATGAKECDDDADLLEHLAGKVAITMPGASPYIKYETVVERLTIDAE